MIFFLIQNTRENRQMIDSDGSRPNCPIEGECEAKNWVEAKLLFGFPLSPIQQLMLAGG